MNVNRLTKHSMRICSLTTVLMVILLMTSSLYAVPIQTFDSSEISVFTPEDVKKNPDRYIDEIKTALRHGDLARVGSLASRLVEVRQLDGNLNALYSIYLASTGNMAKARHELEVATLKPHETMYVLYADAMLKRIEKKYDAAIIVCRKAIDMDQTHPYPWNILGRIYFDSKKYDEAVSSFRRAIELEPDFLPAYANLGATSFMLGNNAESIKYFKKAISLNPDASSAHYGLALVYENTGGYLQAMDELKKSLDINPDQPAALRKLAELQLKVGRYEDARATGQRMEDKGMAEAYIILGDASLRMGNAEQAMTYLQKAETGNSAAQYLLGFCHLTEGNNEKALEAMESVLRNDGNHFGAYIARIVIKFYLGKELKEKEDLKYQWDTSVNKLLYYVAGNINASSDMWDNAIEKWRQAEGLIGGFSIEGIDKVSFKQGLNKKEFRHLNLGVIYYFKELDDSALSEFKKALTVNQNSIMANYWVAQVFLKRRDRTNAIICFEKATKKAPNFFTALYALGELNFLTGNPGLAAEYYQKALKVKRDAGLLIKIGLIYENDEKYDMAAKHYHELIQWYPNFFVGYNQLAWLYARRGVKLETALSLAEKADTLQPGNSSILDTIGWIYFQTKEYKKAIEHLVKAHKSRPDNPTILYHLGAVYRALGDKASANRNLEKALSISQNFREADEARRLLRQ